MGSLTICLAFATRTKAIQGRIRKRKSRSLAHVDDVSLGLLGITPKTVGDFAFLRQELEDIGILVHTSKTVVLPQMAPTRRADEISLIETVDVRVCDEEEVTVVGVSIDTDEYVIKRAREIAKQGGTDHLARFLANMPENKRRPSSSWNPSGTGLDTSKGLLTRG